MEPIYLDYNATTPIAPSVYEAMIPFLTTNYFNPSSMYEPAHGPAEAITAARKTVARLLGKARPDEILFII